MAMKAEAVLIRYFGMIILIFLFLFQSVLLSRKSDPIETFR